MSQQNGYREFGFRGADGAGIAAYAWDTDQPPRAVIQLAHGMGEHARRYAPAVAPLVAAGYPVYANDHRGHGRTAASPGELGDFGPGGFPAVVDDMLRLTGIIRRNHPGLPVVLLGHSMGSFAAQLYAVDHHDRIDALVLSGSAALDELGAAAAEAGEQGLEAFNAPFEPARTPYDWLSRDPSVVDAYIADPLCGFSVNEASTLSMFGAAGRLADPAALVGIGSDLPVYVFSGEQDPVGGNLAFVQTLLRRYREAGLTRVEQDFYPGGRHEMLNETNRDEVCRNLLAWLDDNIPAPGA